MEIEIRKCFTLFQKCLEKTSIDINEVKKYDTHKMSINEISIALDVIYMHWLTTVYVVPKTSPIPFAFNHLKNMINDHYLIINTADASNDNQPEDDLKDLPDLIPNEECNASETKKQLDDVQKVIQSSTTRPLDEDLFKDVYVDDNNKKESSHKQTRKSWW